MGRSRVVRSNETAVTTYVYGPDDWSRQIASLGVATNTFSPMSAGVGTQTFGLPGYGVNRGSGALPYSQGTLQNLAAPSDPVRNPRSKRLGMGAGVSGQPGMPSTGQNALGLLSPLGDVGYTGLG